MGGADPGPSANDSADTKWTKLAALEEKTAIDELRANLWSEHSQLFRWLNASLLAINGGSVLAVFSAEALSLEVRLIACGFFSLGIFSALLIGVFAQRSIHETLPKMQALVGYWLAVSIDGVRDEEIEGDLIPALKKFSWKSRMPATLGWISALLFGAGVVSVGLGSWSERNLYVESTSERSLTEFDDRS